MRFRSSSQWPFLRPLPSAPGEHAASVDLQARERSWIKNYHAQKLRIYALFAVKLNELPNSGMIAISRLIVD